MVSLRADDRAEVAAAQVSCFDPRLKLLLLLVTVVTIFSASDIWPLVLLGLVALMLLRTQPGALDHFRKRVYSLRWLFLFTFLLHLLLTPGRTLFGLKFLTYDGLERALLVDSQLALALFFTICFALATSPESVTWALSRLLRPLEWLGVKVADGGGLMILVLYFVPQVFALGEPLAKNARQVRGQNLSSRIRNLSTVVGGMIVTLVDQADLLARKIVAGQNPLVGMETNFAWGRRDSLCLLGASVLFGACWGF